MVYNNALELIGNTPLVRLNKIEEKLGLKAKILAKVEYFNTTWSFKDRIAFKIISEMEKDGRLVPGSTLIEPTSGNTGIGISIGAALRWAVIEASKEENEGKTIVVIFPDSGDRYLSVEELF